MMINTTEYNSDTDSGSEQSAEYISPNENQNCEPNSYLTVTEIPCIIPPLYNSDASKSGSEKTFGCLSSDENESENKSCATSVNPPHLMFTFTGSNEINYDFDEAGNILQYFESFLDDDVLSMIVEETNRNAELKLRNKNVKKKWEPLTADELRVFLAVQILKGIVKKPKERMYWSKNPTIATPFFAKAITYQRFCLIKQFLRFESNEDFEPDNHPHTKLCKIWPFYEKMVAKFQTNYTPEKFVGIDESLASYKERAGWLQYESFKKASTMIKYFMLCESKSGYVWRFVIHTGKGSSFDREYKDLPVTEQVVMTLMKPLLGRGYCLTVDNSYISPQLTKRLSSNETDVFRNGKVRRNVPLDIKEKKVKRVAGEKAETIQDKKNIQSLSLPDEKTVGADGQSTFDHLVGDHSTHSKRGKLYYKKIFFHIVDLALWNSFLLYKKSGGKESALNYRVHLIECIMEKYHSPLQSTKAGWPGRSSRPLRLTERHFPDTIPRTEKKANPTRVCVVCSRKRDAHGNKVRRESRYHCPDCEVGLCVAPCFKIYHTSGNE